MSLSQFYVSVGTRQADIKSGQVSRYTDIGNSLSFRSAGRLFTLVRQLHKLRWYFPTQAFKVSFKGSTKKIFHKYSQKQDFGMLFAVNMASGGLAAAGSLTIVYPLDYPVPRFPGRCLGHHRAIN